MKTLCDNKVWVEKNPKGIAASDLMRLLITGFNPKADSEPATCTSCGQPTHEFKTVSKIFGEVSITPRVCDDCKAAEYLSHLREEEQKAWLLNQSKCCGYQNIPITHAKNQVMFADLNNKFQWQDPFLAYAMAVCSGEEKRGALVKGSTGSGKTFITKALHNELCAIRRNSVFIKAVDFALALRKEASSYQNDMGKSMREFRNVDVLIIDDYGAQKNTDFVRETMFSILDNRYENNKTTIITTNLDNDELRNAEPRLFSRLMENNWLIKFSFKAPDLRFLQTKI
jgi:DNA replication protein DnaC